MHLIATDYSNSASLVNPYPPARLLPVLLPIPERYLVGSEKASTSAFTFMAGVS